MKRLYGGAYVMTWALVVVNTACGYGMARSGYYNQAGLYILILILIAMYSNCESKYRLAKELIDTQERAIAFTTKKHAEACNRVSNLESILGAKDSLVKLQRRELVSVKKELQDERG